jgi:hypothetical protein
MATGAKGLTAHQKRVLGIVQDGGAQGVAIESVLREEWAIVGRGRSSVFDTVYSLQRRGLVEVTVRYEVKVGEYGLYNHEYRRVTAVQEG